MWDGVERRHGTQIRFCEGHITLCTDIAVIKTTCLSFEKSQKAVEEKIIAHIIEAEKPGGRHERLTKLETAVDEQKKQISAIKKGYYFAGCIGGILGGVVASGAPELFVTAVKLFLK